MSEPASARRTWIDSEARRSWFDLTSFGLSAMVLPLIGWGFALQRKADLTELRQDVMEKAQQKTDTESAIGMQAIRLDLVNLRDAMSKGFLDTQQRLVRVETKLESK